jgi:hypothetical protein
MESKLTREKLNPTEIQLRRRGLVRVEKIRPGTQVVCKQGVLWLTQVGDWGDHFLRPGEKYVIRKRNKLLIEAMRDAAIRLIPPRSAMAGENPIRMVQIA